MASASLWADNPFNCSSGVPRRLRNVSSRAAVCRSIASMVLTFFDSRSTLAAKSHIPERSGVLSPLGDRLAAAPAERAIGVDAELEEATSGPVFDDGNETAIASMWAF